ncbi:MULTISPECIES: PE family protein [Mycobacterium]|uniref:PE domain-containing protein n=1 Tax=Mycobacterium kiyosense TaxID=2871094 RepID=A0A9P3Q6H8_9MYCO|nr:MULTISPECIES: PE family protein [Mycobacterium]BDB39920.1 hypothetical protein IWGMT90018_03660 [Mycobacterium kiyosense]BDE11771.1 hypothetical protein MKCMC460_06310 [Mycobacterium sp. 20KCMC460]GLB84763.1 hypothetical protein SRL2020028_40190 [Mycobacterium kiyosense]GLB87990.1 hypothetical protein SRL2020130_08070 [Mycobacterium kiyosense]GLB95452.1 hypothetical protein SRL2020226_22280 [Mycobacterium kiyosense]
MSHVTVEPQALLDAAGQVQQVGNGITAANQATSHLNALPAAAADEVSTAVAAVFGKYNQQLQGALSSFQAALQQQFAAALTAAEWAYKGADNGGKAAIAAVQASAAEFVKSPVGYIEKVVEDVEDQFESVLFRIGFPHQRHPG